MHLQANWECSRWGYEASYGVGDEVLVSKLERFFKDGRREYRMGTINHELGERIDGRYLIHDVRIGHHGRVFLCHDEIADRPAALKTLHIKNDEPTDLLSEYFLQGTQTWLTAARHIGVVTPYRVFLLPTGAGESVPCLVMELIQGHPKFGNSLWSWIRSQDFSLKLTLYFAHEICSAMATLQKKENEEDDFVHLNLTSQNILISDEGNIKITDIGFGEAYQKACVSGELLSQPFITEHGEFCFGISEGICGVPPYMSPEQCERLQDFDQRSDIYAFGCILYEMCTRRYLFTATTPEDFFEAHMHEIPDPPKKWNPDIPDALVELIEECLEKDPDDRPDDFEQIRDRIKEILQAEDIPSGLNFWLFGFSSFSDNPRVRSDLNLDISEEIILLGKAFGVDHLIKKGLIKNPEVFDRLVNDRQKKNSGALDRLKKNPWDDQICVEAGRW